MKKINKNKSQFPTKDKYAKTIMHLACEEDVWKVAAICEEVIAKNPKLSSKELKQAVIQIAVNREGINDLTAERLYRGCQHTLFPWLKSGEKFLKTDALVDSLIQKAEENLFKKVRDRNGQVVLDENGEEAVRFDSSVMDSIVRALKLKMDSLLKGQMNMIAAQREVVLADEKDSFDIQSSDEKQLEKYVLGEIGQHPDLVERILGTANPDVDSVPSFYQPPRLDG